MCKRVKGCFKFAKKSLNYISASFFTSKLLMFLISKNKNIFICLKYAYCKISTATRTIERVKNFVKCSIKSNRCDEKYKQHANEVALSSELQNYYNVQVQNPTSNALFVPFQEFQRLFVASLNVMWNQRTSSRIYILLLKRRDKIRTAVQSCRCSFEIALRDDKPFLHDSSLQRRTKDADRCASVRFIKCPT